MLSDAVNIFSPRLEFPDSSFLVGSKHPKQINPHDTTDDFRKYEGLKRQKSDNKHGKILNDARHNNSRMRQRSFGFGLWQHLLLLVVTAAKVPHDTLGHGLIRAQL